jgi:hypothetical protein
MFHYFNDTSHIRTSHTSKVAHLCKRNGGSLLTHLIPWKISLTHLDLLGQGAPSARVQTPVETTRGISVLSPLLDFRQLRHLSFHDLITFDLSDHDFERMAAA